MQLRFAIPVSVFVVVAIALGVGLTLNPREIPSPLIGQTIPDFELAALKGRERGFGAADLRQGEVVLVNVFASWCIPCRQEHPLFMDLAQTGDIKIYGINYKDDPDEAAQWLATFGDPYYRAGADRDGRSSIDWGVYGVPETFIVDGNGTILYKRISVVTPKVLREEILPLIARARAERQEARR
jgi:cytochrome c biogenesis protein CcmG/thiol:disulfide interchange protein DsbE